MSTAKSSTAPWALITGASSGIGAAYAKRLAAGGYALVLVARRTDRLDALAAELKTAHGTTTRVEALDLGVPGAASELARALARDGVEIELLVNNAGYGSNGAVLDADLSRELGMIDLNCRALTELTHAIGGTMRARRGGTIIHTASLGGFAPLAFFATYAATKAYVIAFSEAIGAELAPHGVTVQTLCPGATVTEFADVSGFKGKIPAVTQTADEVVAESLAALEKDRGSLLVTGFANRMTAFALRFIPRSVPLKLSIRMNNAAVAS